MKNLTALLCLIIAGGGLVACSEQTIEPPTSEVIRAVKVLQIKGGDDVETKQLPGIIRATHTAELGFEQSGRLVEILVTEGREVKAGELLAKLNIKTFQANYDKALARVNKAKTDYQRSKDLFDSGKGAISKSRLDADFTALDVAKSDLKTAKKALDDTALRAPFDGFIAKRLVENFQTVAPQQAVFVVQDISQLEIQVSVPEKEFIGSDIRKQRATIDQDINPRIVLSGLADQTFAAKLTEFATLADPELRTFKTRFTFTPPREAGILPGMTARVLYDSKLSSDIFIPAKAVFPSANSTYVWVVDEAQTVTKKLVTVGKLRGDTIQITSGLNKGMTIAISGVYQLREGMKIKHYKPAVN